MQLFQYKASLDDYLRFHKMVTLRMPNMSNEFSYGYLRNFLMSDGSDTLLGRKVVYDVERSRLISCIDLSRILYDVCHVFSDEPIDCMYMNTFYYYIGSSSHWESVLGILKSVAGVFIEGSNGNEIFVKDGDGLSKLVGYRLPGNERVLMLSRSISAILDIRLGNRSMFYMLGV